MLGTCLDVLDPPALSGSKHVVAKTESLPCRLNPVNGQILSGSSGQGIVKLRLTAGTVKLLANTLNPCPISLRSRSDEHQCCNADGAL